MPCKQCGKCCKYITMFYPPQPEIEEWVHARGGKIIGKSKRIMMVRFDIECPQLIHAGNGKYNCKLHGENKPYACKVFPDKKMDLTAYNLSNNQCLPKGCGFKWDGEKYV